MKISKFRDINESNKTGEMTLKDAYPVRVVEYGNIEVILDGKYYDIDVEQFGDGMNDFNFYIYGELKKILEEKYNIIIDDNSNKLDYNSDLFKELSEYYSYNGREDMETNEYTITI